MNNEPVAYVDPIWMDRPDLVMAHQLEIGKLFARTQFKNYVPLYTHQYERPHNTVLVPCDKLAEMQVEIEALKEELDKQGKIIPFTESEIKYSKPQFPDKPVAWMMKSNDPDYVSDYIMFKTPERKDKISHHVIPLYTHPVKEQDESFDRTASHMAGEYVSYKAELTDEEIWAIASEIEPVEIQHGVRLSNDLNVLDFARLILRKAQEK